MKPDTTRPPTAVATVAGLRFVQVALSGLSCNVNV